LEAGYGILDRPDWRLDEIYIHPDIRPLVGPEEVSEIRRCSTRLIPDLLEEHGVVYIDGEEKSGRTTLLRKAVL